MKGARVLFGAAAAAFVLAPAVTPARGITDIGLHAGVNTSRFGRHSSDVDPRMGFSIGPYVAYGIADRLGVQAELLYTQKGGTLTSTWWDKWYTDHGVMDFLPGGLPRDPVDVSLAYAELPILARITLPGTRWVRPYVILGPSAAVRIHGGPRYAGIGPHLPQIRKSDMSLVFGGGACVSLGAHDLHVGARYAHGVTAVSEDLGRNVVWSLEVGYGYRL